MRNKGKSKISAVLLIVIILIILGAIALLFVGLNKGWFAFGGINIQSFLKDKGIDDFTADSSCTFHIPEIQACEGEDVTTSIKDGVNGGCRVFFKYNNGDWQVYGDFATDSDGKIEIIDSAEISGDYIFTALCVDENFEICRTNNDEIEIVLCDGDSDGDGWTDEEEIEAGTDPNNPNDHPVDISSYTCGQNDDYCYGTCPTDYPDCYQIYTGSYTWACMCVDELNEVHPDWKPGASNFNEHDETPPECYSDQDCSTNYFCFEGNCEERCIGYNEDFMRTNYLGTSYSACWDICGGNKDCCDNSYMYYDGASYNGKQWYYYACDWYEPQQNCGNFKICIAPGGNHP